MATILELARHADLPAEQVLRVVNGEPVSADVEERVREAVRVLGPPPYGGAPHLAPVPSPAIEAARDSLAASLGRAGAQIEPLRENVGSVVYEALRVEVRPVAEHVSQVSRLVDELVNRLAELRQDGALQRRERIEDLELLTELVTSGWRSVDRRLGRLERMVERLQAQSNGHPANKP